MWNRQSWKSKRDGANCQCQTLKWQLKFSAPWASSSPGANQLRSTTSSDTDLWLPVACASLLLATSAWCSVVPPATSILAADLGWPPGSKPHSEYRCFHLGCAASHSWDLVQLFSKYTYSFLSNVKMFLQMSWVCTFSHQATFRKTLLSLKSLYPCSTVVAEGPASQCQVLLTQFPSWYLRAARGSYPPYKAVNEF